MILLQIWRIGDKGEATLERELPKGQDDLLWGAVSADMTLRLPTEFQYPSPLWDFDFKCLPGGDCIAAVPLTVGCLALYRFPY